MITEELELLLQPLSLGQDEHKHTSMGGSGDRGAQRGLSMPSQERMHMSMQPLEGKQTLDLDLGVSASNNCQAEAEMQEEEDKIEEEEKDGEQLLSCLNFL